MPVINRITEFAADMKSWRRDIHKHPELAFEEQRTADVVAEMLNEWDIEVHRGLATTGVVGLLQGQGGGERMIGLRADMDALPMQEFNEFEHRSVNDGSMHACGHDGHTAMLLGAARYLAETRNFNGRVAFIFQPAEESIGGARVMIEEGLFDKFPVESVYGLHNMPGIPAANIEMRPGPLMAAADTVRITVTGRGGHAAMPDLAVDPVPIAAQIITALQTIASRSVDPLDSVVVSICCVHGGSAENVIPETVELVGSVRTFQSETQDRVEKEIQTICEGVAVAMKATADVDYQRGYPTTVNSEKETAWCADVAAEIVGADRISTDTALDMGSEDFSFMLREKPGCYVLLGNGTEGGPGGCSVHNPNYDFNDEIAVTGASYWARLVETLLPA